MNTTIDKIFLGTGNTEEEMAILHSVSQDKNNSDLK